GGLHAVADCPDHVAQRGEDPGTRSRARQRGGGQAGRPGGAAGRSRRQPRRDPRDALRVQGWRGLQPRTADRLDQGARGDQLNHNPVWDDAQWPGFPALRGAVACDVCVVGLGGSGLAAIDELLTLGKRVIGIDAGHVAGGAAGRNGGFLLAGPADFHHDAIRTMGHDAAVDLYRRTLDEIARMKRETPDAIRLDGSLRIAETDAELEDCRKQLDAMRADGLAAEWYEGPEGKG